MPDTTERHLKPRWLHCEQGGSGAGMHRTLMWARCVIGECPEGWGLLTSTGSLVACRWTWLCE